MSDEIPEIRGFSLRPSDLIVVTVPRGVALREIEDIRKTLREKFPDNEIVALGGVGITVLRRDPT